MLATLPKSVTVASTTDDTSDFWRFTKISARKLFATHFDEQSIELAEVGTVFTAIAALHGSPADTITSEEILQSDVQFPDRSCWSVQ